ncbi:MAG: hypothetical protein CEN90_248 [Parcubacteria group bacterium Licking1014_17]|nr:MAG: hypothetical protein CEN90_248 [Parcubacteria group bacterium Licking1014_17]
MTGINVKLKKNNRAGFTLVEILVASTIFATIIVVVSGVFVSALKEQRRSFDTQQVQETMTYMIERMTKEIRVSEILEPATMGDCVSSITIQHPDNGIVKYYKTDGTFEANRDVLSSLAGPVTESSILNFNLVEVVDLKFCIFGQDPDDSYQPRVTIIGAVRATGSDSVENFQTTVSLRQLQSQ